MKKSFIYSLAILAVLISCAKTELPHFGGENDPNAVTINPSVAVLSTRSNPLGDATAQRQFNVGDVITIKDKSDNAVYKYALGSDGIWKPTDGKYLLWHSETLTLEASYGEKGDDPAEGVTQQKDAAQIASADYMTFSGQVSRYNGSNELLFTMERQQALVTVIIDSYGNQYNPDTDLISEFKIGNINPYIRDAKGDYSEVRDNGTLGYSYSAIVPNGQSLLINYTVGSDTRREQRTVAEPTFTYSAGKSYTIKIRVGKDKIEIGDISVSEWTSADNWTDVEANTYTPYICFSADSEQEFSMTFNGFSPGTNEYFEYSVGDGNWVMFTGTVSKVPFGGARGDLRLRGKSSKGTARELSYYSTIKFSDANVPVYCTGDIRALIDYEAYLTVSTDEARFCSLFSGNTMLVTAPELPATTLAPECYYCMFQGCTSLTTAPVLPAEILETECYVKMFDGCTALSKAPVLPAETLVDFCYAGMFNNCTSLSEVTMLATDVNADRCLDYWLGSDAGTSASTRTLTLANDEVYAEIQLQSNLPEIWRKDASGTTVNFQSN